MRALRLHGVEDLRLDEVPEPTPGPGQVKLRNGFTGICGSDLHLYFDPASVIDLQRPHPLTGSTLPQILGHEFAGEVVEVGEGVTLIRQGDLAAVRPTYSCGRCAACTLEARHACTRLGAHGISSAGGGMAEYTVVAAGMLHRLPRGLDLVHGALVEPMAVAWHAVARSGAEPGHAALVLGAGAIGIGAWYALRQRAVEMIIVSEPSKSRRDALRALGAETVVDPATEDLRAVVRDRTAGRGVDVAIEAAGLGRAVEQGLRALRPLGRLVVVALHERSFDFQPTSVVRGEKEIVGSLMYTAEDFDGVIGAMVAGVYATAGWTEVIEMEGVEEAFHRLRGGVATKVLVAPAGQPAPFADWSGELTARPTKGRRADAPSGGAEDQLE
jgi:(R,R)-butanediol dehydrogenase / meso-butanediol dehydrogenase / diacetyl reductase